MQNFPKIKDFPTLRKLLEEFPESEVFLVGGAVRDTLLGKKITDIDILVRNVEPSNLEDFLAEHGRVVFAGRSFGVWKFNEIGKPRNEIYDIALPRTEFSMHKQGIYKDFKIATNPALRVEEDLKRRDFTINAIAYNLSSERIIDPHDGIGDLKRKTIKCVGDPALRFSEDYSRILRAIRFSIQLGFEIDKPTEKEIKKNITKINNEYKGKRIVPFEIISEEFLKSLKKNPVLTIDKWSELGAASEILPEIEEMKGCAQPENWHNEGDVWTHTRMALKNLYSEEFEKEFPNQEIDLELIVATLFHDIGKPYTIETPEKDKTDRIRFNDHDAIGASITKIVLERIKASSPPDIGIDIENVSWLVKHHMTIVHGDPEFMRPNTIEKYFFKPEKPSKNLLKLMFTDGLSTIGQDGKGLTEKFYKLKKKMEEIKIKTKSQGNTLVKPLVTGDDIIKELKLKPSKKIGQILEKLRTKQLNGEISTREEALSELKKYED